VRYINLGATNISVSVVGFGAWAIGGRWWGGTDVSESIKAIEASIEKGVNLIDTAPAYGKGLSEEIVGKAIKGKRDRVVLATKCGMVWHTDQGDFWYKYDDETTLLRNLTRQSITYELEQSLKRLGTDYIDLYQTHIQDPDTPISDTMETLLQLKKEGKIRAIGASNAATAELAEYKRNGDLDSDQEKYSILDTEVEKQITPWCMENNVTFLAYSPLSQGLLTGKVLPGRKFKDDDIRIGSQRFSDKNLEKINTILTEKLKPIADIKKLTLSQLAISWVISHANIVALCGARNAVQAVENAAAGDAVIMPEEINNIKGYFS
jgi:methylglyoxal reductase